MKKALIALACLLLAFAVLVGGYVSYVYISYERLDDRLVLDIDKGADDYLKIGQTYTAATYNIGFGA